MLNTPIPNPLDYAGFVLWQKANALEKSVNESLKPFGINQTEMFHLISIKFLTFKGESLTQTELAKFTGVTTMAVSKILRKLESNLWITRQIGSDPRSKTILVTESGFDLLIATASILHNINTQLL